MAELRSPKEILDLLLVSPNYNSVAVSVNEEDAFVKVFGLSSFDAWEEHGQGSGRFKTEISTTHLKFTDTDRRFVPFPGLLLFQLMEVKLLSPITLMVNNESQFLHMAPEVANHNDSLILHMAPEVANANDTLMLVSDEDPRAWVEISHDADSIYIASTSYEGNWKLDMIASMLLIVPADTDMPKQLEVTPPPHGKVPKEYTTMKPEFMKKPSVTRHAEQTAQTTVKSWRSNRPALKVGKLIVEVDTEQRSDEEVGKLRSEWFWAPARNATGDRTTLSFDMAIANQDDLIDTANAFGGIRVHHATVDGKQYHLPLLAEDDLSLICLLDKTVWTKTETVYPSVVEHWSHDPDCENHEVVPDLRAALMVQADIWRLRQTTKDKTAVTKASAAAAGITDKPAGKRKPRSKGPRGGSGKVTSE